MLTARFHAAMGFPIACFSIHSRATVVVLISSTFCTRSVVVPSYPHEKQWCRPCLSEPGSSLMSHEGLSSECVPLGQRAFHLSPVRVASMLRLSSREGMSTLRGLNFVVIVHFVEVWG